MNPAVELIITDYPNSLVHLFFVYSHCDKIGQLVFGLVEAFPDEISDLPESSPAGVPQKILKGGRHTLWYSRRKLPTQEAVDWYLQGGLKKTITLPWAPDAKMSIVCDNLAQPIPWPNMIAAADTLPYRSQIWKVVRNHSFLPMADNTILEKVFDDSNASKFIDDQLAWPLSKFKEYWGSLNLILPNPIYRDRDSHSRLLPNEGEGEKIRISLIPRLGREKEIEKLRLYQLEWNHWGLGPAVVKNLELDQTVTHSRIIDKIAYAVVCPERGVLDFMDFTPYTRQAINHIYVAQPVRYNFKSGQDKRTSEGMMNYPEPPMVVGRMDDDYFTWSNYYHCIKYKRDLAEETRLGRQIWLNDKEEAKKTIKGLIKMAEHRLIIVDAYFANGEIVNFLDAISYATTKPLILTSKKPFHDTVSSPQTAGHPPSAFTSNSPHDFKVVVDEFNKNRESLKVQPVAVKIMQGEHFIHDRFLVVDDTVWLSGNSLNNIGDQASMLVSLKDSASVIQKINEAISDPSTQTFDQFLSERKAGQTQNVESE